MAMSCMNNRNKNNIMRKILKYGFIAVVICFTSCETVGDKYDKMELVDIKTGNIYILDHHHKDAYFIHPKMKQLVDTTYCR